MNKDELKLQALITLDEISDNALDKLLHKNDSSIRICEKSIADLLLKYAERITESSEKMQDMTTVIEETAGRILDITSKMNHSCLKAGLQTGSQIMLELLQIL